MQRHHRPGRSTFVLGGARSGKSTIAQALAGAAGSPVSVVVTADLDLATAAGDNEMLDRVARHQTDRPSDWTTVEAGHRLVDAVSGLDGTVLIDCITMWLSALLPERDDPAEAERAVAELAALVASRSGTTIIVSNEVGQGVVPVEPLGRAFRDLQGRANQTLARACDRAVLVVAGMLLPLSDPTDIFKELR